MAYKPQLLDVADGGTGSASLVAYTPISGGTTGTNPIQSVVSLSTSGYSLKSNGAASLPTFQEIANTYAINFMSANISNPVDSTTYYTSTQSTAGLDTNINDVRSWIHVPYTGTLISVIGNVHAATTPSSGESITQSILINGSADNNLSSAVTWTSTSNAFSYTGLSISVTAGDRLQMKYITPAWVTNPVNIKVQFSLLIKTTL